MCAVPVLSFWVLLRSFTKFGLVASASSPLDPCESANAATFELFGDYDPETMLIRVWMRTAVRKEITSFGTFLSTLCHEFCHHLDYQKFGFHDSWHTRGFYERAAVLYHYARGTPPKKLFWVPTAGGRWRIDWRFPSRSKCTAFVLPTCDLSGFQRFLRKLVTEGWIMEDAETVCGLRVRAATGAIVLPKVTLVSHSPHYLGRGGMT